MQASGSGNSFSGGMIGAACIASSIDAITMLRIGLAMHRVGNTAQIAKRPGIAAGAFRCVSSGWTRRGQSTFGSVSNWWYGGGELSVHSSVVAPSPQGLSPAFLPAISDQIRLTKKIAMPTAIRL